MFRKNNTIKIRITLLSFLIMIVTVSSIMFTEYMLQRSLSYVVVNMDKTSKDDNSFDVSGVNESRITSISNEVFMKKQREKFILLVLISTVLLLIGMSLIYLVIRKELKPLENLKNKMDNMDFQTDKETIIIPKSSTSEITSLTNSYNLMITNLKKSYELQKRFSQNAAHELRTPITTMKASLQVNKLVENKNKMNDKELLNVIDEQVIRMEKIVKGLLQLNNKSKVDKKMVNINNIIEINLENFKKQINEKKLRVEVIGNMEIETDENIISIILKNLIENAIRYNKLNGCIKVELSDNIIISDTGIGIAKKEQENIFSPFYCVDQSRSKQFGGIGLGLSIVQAAIEQLDYRLEIVSTVDKGTTFIIKLH